MADKNPKISNGSILPLTEMLNVRVPKPMAVMVKQQAMHHGTDVSAVIRQLIREGAAARGIDARFI